MVSMRIHQQEIELYAKTLSNTVCRRRTQSFKMQPNFRAISCQTTQLISHHLTVSLKKTLILCRNMADVTLMRFSRLQKSWSCGHNHGCRLQLADVAPMRFWKLKKSWSCGCNHSCRPQPLNIALSKLNASPSITSRKPATGLSIAIYKETTLMIPHTPSETNLVYGTIKSSFKRISLIFFLVS